MPGIHQIIIRFDESKEMLILSAFPYRFTSE